MLSSVSTLLLRLMIYCSVVYRNGIGVMNIQLAEEYKNAEKGEKECGFGGNGSRGSREGHLELGLERRSRSRGPELRRWCRGSREEGHLEPGLEKRSRSRGPELWRWSQSRGPREEGCSKEYEHEEEGLKRTWHKVIRVMYVQRLRKQRWNGLEKERLWGAINSESVWNEPGPAVVPPPPTVNATDSTTGRRPLIQRVPLAPPDVASSRLWWHGLCALECVSVMSEAWPGLWNIIYLVAPGFMLMVCSSVAVVKITIVNWMKYHGYDVHIMLRERGRVHEWITQSAWVRACRMWSLWDCMHICVSVGCPLLLSNKTTTSNSKDRSTEISATI